jgi:hypothetical protein
MGLLSPGPLTHTLSYKEGTRYWHVDRKGKLRWLGGDGGCFRSLLRLLLRQGRAGAPQVEAPRRRPADPPSPALRVRRALAPAELSQRCFLIFGCVLSAAPSQCATATGVLFFYRSCSSGRGTPATAARRTHRLGESYRRQCRISLKYAERAALARRRRCRVTAHDSADSRDAPPMRVAACAARRHSPRSQLVAVQA